MAVYEKLSWGIALIAVVQDPIRILWKKESSSAQISQQLRVFHSRSLLGTANGWYLSFSSTFRSETLPVA